MYKILQKNLTPWRDSNPRSSVPLAETMTKAARAKTILFYLPLSSFLSFIITRLAQVFLKKISFWEGFSDLDVHRSRKKEDMLTFWQSYENRFRAIKAF
jgi:hypothetical protein